MHKCKRSIKEYSDGTVLDLAHDLVEISNTDKVQVLQCTRCGYKSVGWKK